MSAVEATEISSFWRWVVPTCAPRVTDRKFQATKSKDLKVGLERATRCVKIPLRRKPVTRKRVKDAMRRIPMRAKQTYVCRPLRQKRYKKPTARVNCVLNRRKEVFAQRKGIPSKLVAFNQNRWYHSTKKSKFNSMESHLFNFQHCNISCTFKQENRQNVFLNWGDGKYRRVPSSLHHSSPNTSWTRSHDA